MSCEIDRVIYYGENTNMWCLQNNNYHQMVSVMMQIIKNLSPLRIEAPEWYPIQKEDQVSVSKKSIDENAENEWQVPKKRSQKINGLGNVNTKCYNQHDVLSDEDDEDDDEDEEHENDITNEMRKEIEEGERRIRFFREKTKILEEENRILGNRIVTVECEKTRLEQRNEELVNSSIEREDIYVNIVDTIVDRFIFNAVVKSCWEYLKDSEINQVKQLLQMRSEKIACQVQRENQFKDQSLLSSIFWSCNETL